MQISAEPGRTSAVGSVRSATWPFRTRVWKSVVRAVAAAMHKPEPSLRPRLHSRCRHRQHGADSHAISTGLLWPGIDSSTVRNWPARKAARVPPSTGHGSRAVISALSGCLRRTTNRRCPCQGHWPPNPAPDPVCTRAACPAPFELAVDGVWHSSTVRPAKVATVPAARIQLSHRRPLRRNLQLLDGWRVWGCLAKEDRRVCGD